MKTIQAIVAENIKSRMREMGITQKDLAEKMKTSQPTVSAWVKSETLPDKRSQEKLCQALGVTIDRLVYVKSKDDLTDALAAIGARLELIESLLRRATDVDLEKHDIKTLAAAIKKRAAEAGVSSYDILKSELAACEEPPQSVQNQTNPTQKKAP